MKNETLSKIDELQTKIAVCQDLFNYAKKQECDISLKIYDILNQLLSIEDIYNNSIATNVEICSNYDGGIVELYELKLQYETKKFKFYNELNILKAQLDELNEEV